jgi:hypothetical protein
VTVEGDRLRALADRHQRPLARVVARVIDAARDAVTDEQVRRALTEGRTAAVVELVPWRELLGRVALADQPPLFDDAYGAVSQVMIDAGALTAEARLDVLNPWAERAALEHAAELVTGVEDETRLAIRQTVARATRGLLTVDEAARVIRTGIGLNTRQAGAVVNLALGLKDAGTPPGRAATLLDRYRRRAVRDRAEMIARTEVMRAVNAGQDAVWREQAAAGVVPPTARRVWVVTPDERLCPRCGPLEGETVELLGRFGDVVGHVSVSYPPLHPRCRCTLSLVVGPDE